MEDEMAFQASNNIIPLFNPTSIWTSNSSSSTSFHGETNTMQPIIQRQPEKKRRLMAEQVEYLEKSFEEESKLEPERKIQLAKELNLQPRQVAIWFQNRRARSKAKQLEKDYRFLKSNYDNLKSEFDCLQKDNEKLKTEVQILKKTMLQREKPKEEKPNPNPNVALMVKCKQEDAISVSANSPFQDSSNVFSDFSQDEEDNFSINILRLPKRSTCDSYFDLSEPHFGYPLEDQNFWLLP